MLTEVCPSCNGEGRGWAWSEACWTCYGQGFLVVLEVVNEPFSETLEERATRFFPPRLYVPPPEEEKPADVYFV